MPSEKPFTVFQAWRHPDGEPLIFPRCAVMYQHLAIEPNPPTGNFHAGFMSTWLQAKQPLVEDSAIVSLDWEAPHVISDLELSNAAAFARAITHRSVGYYNRSGGPKYWIPGGLQWDDATLEGMRGALVTEAAAEYAALLANVDLDYLSPSVYLPYPEEHGGDENFVRARVRAARYGIRQHGGADQIPVYAFIWQRTAIDWEYISLDRWRGVFEALIAEGADGAIWWDYTTTPEVPAQEYVEVATEYGTKWP